MNPDYDKIAEVPIDIAVRNEIGRALDLDEIGLVPGAVGQLLAAKDDYRDAITRSREQYVYNLGRSAEVGAQYIISAIQSEEKSSCISTSGSLRNFSARASMYALLCLICCGCGRTTT